MAVAEPSAVERNLSFYRGFWEDTPDFIRYNPGARHRRRMILDLLRGLRFDSLLDVGCGNGELIALVAAQSPGIRLTGADLSPDQIERNQRRLPGVEFFALDVQSAALPRTFDMVTCSEVIEHLDDAAAALRNLARMVAPGGHLLVTCPAGTMYATERHFGHVRHPKVGDLTAWADAAGLEVDTILELGLADVHGAQVGDERQRRVGSPQLRERCLHREREGGLHGPVLAQLPEPAQRPARLPAGGAVP